MTVTDLIMELAQMPPDLEVIYDNTQEKDNGFRMVIVQNVGEIATDDGKQYVLLNVDVDNNNEEDEDI